MANITVKTSKPTKNNAPDSAKASRTVRTQTWLKVMPGIKVWLKPAKNSLISSFTIKRDIVDQNPSSELQMATPSLKLKSNPKLSNKAQIYTQ